MDLPRQEIVSIDVSIRIGIPFDASRAGSGSESIMPEIQIRAVHVAIGIKIAGCDGTKRHAAWSGYAGKPIGGIVPEGYVGDPDE